MLQDIIEKTNRVCKGQEDIKFISVPPSVKKNIIEQHEDIIKSNKNVYYMKNSKFNHKSRGYGDAVVISKKDDTIRVPRSMIRIQ